MNKEFEGDNRIKQLTPGIQRESEKRSFSSLNSHQSQLKNEELFFRMLSK
jgi:hypothetical protein